MSHIIVPVLVLLVSLCGCRHKKEPAENVSDDSSRHLVCQIPAGFKLVSQEQTYLNPQTHEVPVFRRMWQNGPNSIVISIFTMPDMVWHRDPKQMFADGLMGMLSDPALKTAPRQTYELDGASAISIIGSYNSPGENSQRMDFILMKPKIYMVAYLSPRPLSWDDPLSKAFFQTLSVKSKK